MHAFSKKNLSSNHTDLSILKQFKSKHCDFYNGNMINLLLHLCPNYQAIIMNCLCPGLLIVVKQLEITDIKIKLVCLIYRIKKWKDTNVALKYTI